MENQEAENNKVYVVLGNDSEDGCGILEWALKKWSSHSISIVIIHADSTMSKNYVYTPFGKLPATSLNDERMEFLKKSEQGKMSKTLSKYIAFCGKVKAEILNIDRYDGPIHKIIVELISGLRITKLVMGITLLKSSSSSWKSRSMISRFLYVQRQKPEFCDLFVVCGGKPVLLREENNDALILDDQTGVMVAKIKGKVSFKDWIGKMFPPGHGGSPSSPSATTNNGLSPDQQWQTHAEEMEQYYNQLVTMSLNLEEEQEQEDDHVMPRLDLPENLCYDEKIKALKIKIAQARKAILFYRKKLKENAEKRAKAEWATCLCTRRAEEMEARRNEELAKRVDTRKEIEAVKEELGEIGIEVDNKKSKLGSMLEIQRELSSKLQSFSLEKSRGEAQLVKEVRARAEILREIDELRRQRDVLQRRIEFCRDKDAICKASKLSELGYQYKEFAAPEIRTATDNFSERLRLKSAGDWTSVYRGRIKHVTVAIKLYNSLADGLSQKAFQDKVNLLKHVQHPNIVAMIGFCSELKCIVFEYMHHGCLRDALFAARSDSRSRNRSPNWHARIRIAAEVCSGMGFIHLAQPRAIIHCSLNPSKILLDHNNVAKIHGLEPFWSPEVSCRNFIPNMRPFGNLIMQLLTGRNWAGLVEEAILTNHAALAGVLDQNAGEWPLDLAVELANIAMKCLSSCQEVEMDWGMAMAMREIKEVKKKADALAAAREYAAEPEGAAADTDSSNVPRVFICPILQDVMKNPYLAADGFSYELEAIEEWLRTGHDTSPMTNLKLKSKLLTPNHTFRSLIQDWHNKRSISLRQT